MEVVYPQLKIKCLCGPSVHEDTDYFHSFCVSIMGLGRGSVKSWNGFTMWKICLFIKNSHIFHIAYCNSHQDLSTCGCVALGQLVIIIFRQSDGYANHFSVFWDADSESDIENLEFKKWTARATWYLEIAMGTKKSEFENFNKKGS